MKIAICSNTSWYIYNFRENLIRTLKKNDHEVLVIAPRDSYANKLTALGVKHYDWNLSRRGKNPFREIVSCRSLLRLLRAIKPDMVLTFTVKCNLYAGLCRRFLKFEQIANISGLGEAFDGKGFVNCVVSHLYRFALTGAKRVFFQNDEDRQTIIERGLLPKDSCTRIPGSGVDLDAYCPSHPFPGDRAMRFLMFGRLVPKKGYDLFMKAAEHIRLKRESDAEFWIMGMLDESRQESKDLLERILKLHNKGVIRYMPASDDVATVLEQADVVVLPSEYNEGVPRSLLEAMACGKPIITSNWKGCRDTVEHGKNGYLAKAGDHEDLKRYVLQFLDTRVEKLHKMGMASREKAQREFDEREILNAYLSEIEGSISDRSTAHRGKRYA